MVRAQGQRARPPSGLTERNGPMWCRTCEKTEVQDIYFMKSLDKKQTENTTCGLDTDLWSPVCNFCLSGDPRSPETFVLLEVRGGHHVGPQLTTLTDGCFLVPGPRVPRLQHPLLHGCLPWEDHG